MTTVHCETCNSELKRTNYQIKNSKTKTFFCNKLCRSKWDALKFESQKIICNCLNCNKEFKKVKSSDKIFCSNKCLGEHKSKLAKVILNCDNCGKHIEKKKAMVNTNNFCNKKCCSEWNSKKSLKKVIQCWTCGIDFVVQNNRQESAKTCSKQCDKKYKSFISKNDKVLNSKLRKNAIKSVKSMRKKNTLPEQKVRNYLEEKNIKYIEQFSVLDKYLVDFYLPDINLIIEVYGDYWHSNPKVYGEGKTPLNEYQKNKLKKDKSRNFEIEKEGFELIIIWEKEINEDLEYHMNNIINQYP